MRVTKKGQVTIPLAIHEQLGIQTGAEVEFVVDGNAVKLVFKRSGQTRGKRIVDRLRGRVSVRMTTDEIMAVTRGAR